MGLKKVLGVNYTSPIEVLLIVTQLVCYANAYYVNVILLGPLPFLLILLITLMYSRALTALQMGNSVHLETNKHGENVQYCKGCAIFISNRDHHCIFTARCVQKNNYCYFLSYILYSYLLSAHTLFNLVNNNELYFMYNQIELKFYICLIIALVSSLYFIVFTAAMLSSSFRSLLLGIYTVDELKKIKTPKYSNAQIRNLWFSKEGRLQIFESVRENWKVMVGEDVSILRILIVY